MGIFDAAPDPLSGLSGSLERVAESDGKNSGRHGDEADPGYRS
jgi:hypothetical protein